MAVLAMVLASALPAQLAEWGRPIPKRDKPPVVFITGHDALCPAAVAAETPYFNLTFGEFDKVMARHGRVSLVFEACYAPGRPPIEQVAQRLGELFALLTYEDGEPVREVDAVAHSMGGLILRAYLAGKRMDGTFAPPATPRVRKAVFIGTMHFGSAVGTSTHTDPQVRQMATGSRFLFDLATWNQGTDDLRGIDSLAIAGTAGRNGPATDSVVSLQSASIDFAQPGRTAVLPLCHTQGGIGQLFLCEAAPGLARVKDDDHPTARIVLAFLNGTDPMAVPAMGSHPVLASTAGLLIESRNAQDQPQPIRSASVVAQNGRSVRLAPTESGLAFAEMVPAGPVQLEVDGVVRRVVLAPGGTRPLVVKPGPLLESVEPAAGRTSALVLAPGMLVSMRGANLNPGATEMHLASRPVRVVSAADDRLLAVVPEDAQEGLHELSVRNAAGRHTIRVLIENAFPVLLSRDGAAATRQGDVLSLFLVGLGGTVLRDGLGYARQQPVVTVQDRPCEVLYAGRAPGMPGVDQINCRPTVAVQPGTALIKVTSGMRTAAAEMRVR